MFECYKMKLNLLNNFWSGKSHVALRVWAEQDRSGINIVMDAWRRSVGKCKKESEPKGRYSDTGMQSYLPDTSRSNEHSLI